MDSRQGHSDYAEGEVCRGGEEANLEAVDAVGVGAAEC